MWTRRRPARSTTRSRARSLRRRRRRCRSASSRRRIYQSCRNSTTTPEEEGIMNRRHFTLAAVAALFTTWAFAADIDYGKPGTPVKLLVGTDAPAFANDKEAIRWLNGKIVAVPKGSCTDRFAQAVFRKSGIQPKEYLNQNIEVITSNFRAGKLDAAVMWEPTTSRLVGEGLARLIATGASVNENDAGNLGMRADLIKQRPDVVKAWLQAELDAQLFLADTRNHLEVVKMAKEQTTGFSEKVLWNSLYGQYPASAGGTATRNVFHYTFTPEVRELIGRAAAFLYSIKSINVEKLRPEAIEAKWTEDILKERGLKAPIGQVKALPDSQAPKG